MVFYTRVQKKNVLKYNSILFLLVTKSEAVSNIVWPIKDLLIYLKKAIY